MPIFKADNKLLYYAHVPKCGGSAVAWYLSRRFGKVAFSDKFHTRHDPAGLWSKTSPQHIDAVSLGRLFPAGFFDASFTIVRHPVARMVSAYHFQLEIEKQVAAVIDFSTWLDELEDMRAENPFLYDNHVRPMAEIVPEGSKVFHMEHGLDMLVPWLDELTGSKAEPRAIPRINDKGTRPNAAKVVPSDTDLERIARLYAADFERFGYSPDRKVPATPAPALSPEQADERDRALQAMRGTPLSRLTRKVGRKLKL